MKDLSKLGITAIALLLGAGVAWAGSQGGATVGTLPAFGLIVGIVFLIQIIVFVPSFIRQTEHFYDVTGSLTYISMTVLAAFLVAPLDLRSALLAGLVMVWAVRLGTFLFRRVRKSGKDSRFDDIKSSFVRFLNVWIIQALWVTLTAGAAWAAVTSAARAPLDALTVVGVAVWAIGFGIEVIADLQKSRFRAERANRGRFISTGLWSWSRHPNYFGEITLWLGVALIAFPVLTGWQLVTLISPVFVFLLITRVSGVPLLEKSADERWGGQADYEAYKAQTSVLVPLPPRPPSDTRRVQEHR